METITSDTKVADNTANAEFLGLFKVCTDVLESSDQLKLNKDNPIYTGLRRFKKVFESPKTKVDDFLPEIKKVYDTNIKHILNTDRDDVWLEKGISITYGVEKHGVKIYLSTIFAKAVARKKEILKLPDLNTNVEYPECKHPEILIIHLFRLFKLVCPEIDKEQITKIIKLYEEAIDLQEGEKLESKKGNNQMPGNFPFADLMGFSQSLFKNIKPPDPNKPFDSSVISETFKGVLSSPETKNMLKGLGIENGGGNVENVVDNITKVIDNPELTGAIANAVKGAQKIAPPVPPTQNKPDNTDQEVVNISVTDVDDRTTLTLINPQNIVEISGKEEVKE